MNKQEDYHGFLSILNSLEYFIIYYTAKMLSKKH